MESKNVPTMSKMTGMTIFVQTSQTPQHILVSGILSKYIFAPLEFILVDPQEVHISTKCIAYGTF